MCTQPSTYCSVCSLCVCDLVTDCLRVMQKKPSTTIKPSSWDATRSNAVVPTPPPTAEAEVSSSKQSTCKCERMHVHVSYIMYVLCTNIHLCTYVHMCMYAL